MNGDRAALNTSSSEEARERLWAYEDFTPAEEHPGFDATGSFASLGFIRSSLRRGLLTWLALGIIGLMAGAGLFAGLPPAYQASTSIFLTHDPNVDPLSQIETDQALVSSRTVAGRALAQTGTAESVSAFLSSYTTSIVTNQVLLITARAKNSAQAVTNARAIAAAFLAFRATMLQSQQQQEEQTLATQIAEAQRPLNALDEQISQLTSQPATATSQATLTKLRKQRTDAETALTNLQTTASASDAQATVTTADMVNGSEVLDTATALPRSKLKYLAFYLAGGLVVGLGLGMGLVVIRALVSDRLRRRADVATALGAPVRLSVGRVRRKNGKGRRDVVRHLHNAIPTKTSSPATLAIVAVDNAALVAHFVSSLARRSAQDGQLVVVADLTPRARAARLLGSGEAGVRRVTVDGFQVTTFVPAQDTVVAGGPLRRDGVSAADPDLVSACRTADLLLTFTGLDPALGSDHLPTWASDAVAVVTAGRSSAPRLYAVGEMVRLSGTRLASAVLVGADRLDVSFGTPATPGQPLLTAPGG